MRGALVVIIDDHLVVAGIIPADAGSTQKSSAWWIDNKDHPRGCGEHINVSSSGIDLPGSSPRMRGARCIYWREPYCIWIIPADAGSTYPV